MTRPAKKTSLQKLYTKYNPAIPFRCMANVDNL